MPAKRSPSSVLASKAWRPAAIRKTALRALSAPQRAVAAGGLPAGIVDVDHRRRPDLPLEPGVRAGERLAGPLDDRVDRAGRQLDPEQLPGELGRVAARDTVADGEGHDRGLQPRPERRAGHTGWKLGPRLGGADRAAQPVQAVLADPHRHRRQLGDLVPRSLSSINALPLGEDVRTGRTPLRPVLDDLVDPLSWKQRPMAALVPKLAAPLASTRRPLRPRRRRRRVLRGRQRRVSRVPTQPPLELGHPSLQPPICLHQLADP
jgi:hypothetical protein